ncbi:unnamed protein product [Phytophthora fragariaefolia]|uniref:Unnamed protein product n=1 Tax=Phytophthora fragariaefolia TaxID=1490495 RepID=A0A9W6XKR0_9STRA|nr:unnamed protein product [Phytophthora fragariaefolia]
MVGQKRRTSSRLAPIQRADEGSGSGSDSGKEGCDSIDNEEDGYADIDFEHHDNDEDDVNLVRHMNHSLTKRQRTRSPSDS